MTIADAASNGVASTDGDIELPEAIRSCRKLQELRSNSGLVVRSTQSLNAGDRLSAGLLKRVLSGPDMLSTPQVFLSKPIHTTPARAHGASAKSVDHPHQLLAFMRIGHELRGHAGIVHGGIISTLLDECLSLVAASAVQAEAEVETQTTIEIPEEVKEKENAMLTVTLDLVYRAAVVTGGLYLIHTWVSFCDGGFVTVEGSLSDALDEKSVVLTQAKAMFKVA